MNRRGFLASMLAAAAAPAIVRADSLMRIVPMDTEIIVPGGRLLSIDEITRMALKVAHEQAGFISAINREYDKAFAKGGRGLTIRAGNRYRLAA